MSNLLKIEFFKMRKSLAVKITLLICALMCLMNVGIYAVMSNFSEFSEQLGMSIDGYTLFYTCIRDSSDVLMLVTIVSCIIIGGEFSSRTLQSQIIAGYSRTQVILSRFISAFVLMVIFSLVYTVIIAGGTSLFVGFGVEFSSKIFGEMVLSYCMSLFMSYSIMTLYLLIIFIFKSVGPSLGVTMPIMLVGTSIITILASINDIAEKVLSFTPFGQLMVLGDSSLDALAYIKFFGVGLVYMAIMIVAVIVSFRKAELK